MWALYGVQDPRFHFDGVRLCCTSIMHEAQLQSAECCAHSHGGLYVCLALIVPVPPSLGELGGRNTHLRQLPPSKWSQQTCHIRWWEGQTNKLPSVRGYVSHNVQRSGCAHLLNCTSCLLQQLWWLAVVSLLKPQLVIDRLHYWLASMRRGANGLVSTLSLFACR